METDRQKQQAIAQKLVKVPLQKRDTLLRLLQKEGIDPASLPILVSDTPIGGALRHHTQSFPLSWAQERLWFMEQLEGRTATYNLPALFRVQGPVDLTALQSTLNIIVQRHAALRTTFTVLDDMPMQVVHDQGEWPLEVKPIPDRLSDRDPNTSTNGCSLPSTNAISPTALAFAHREAQQPFDLINGPLVRAVIMPLAPDDALLLFNRHHIIWDGWSNGIFTQELAQLYPAYRQLQSLPSFSLLPIQYGDYAVWQRQWFMATLFKEQLSYWQQQLAGAPPLLKLPTDHPRPPVQRHQGCTQSVQIDSELTHRLQKLSQQSDKTLFVVVFAAFTTLLYRYSNQPDILVGSPVANRNHPDVAEVIGFFVNTIVLRVQFEDNPRFTDVLEQVKEVTAAAYAHQDIPFEQVVAAIAPQRNPSYSPLYQVRFVWQQDLQGGALTMDGLTLTPLPQDTGTAKFDLLVDLTNRGDRIDGFWEYNTDLFEDATIGRLIRTFETLLQEIVAQPNCPVQDIPLLSQSDMNTTTHTTRQKLKRSLKQTQRRSLKLPKPS